jgi:hypothetical protein
MSSSLAFLSFETMRAERDSNVKSLLILRWLWKRVVRVFSHMTDYIEWDNLKESLKRNYVIPKDDDIAKLNITYQQEVSNVIPFWLGSSREVIQGRISSLYNDFADHLKALQENQTYRGIFRLLSMQTSSSIQSCEAVTSKKIHCLVCVLCHEHKKLKILSFFFYIMAWKNLYPKDEERSSNYLLWSLKPSSPLSVR